MSDELTGLLVAAAIDGALCLLFRGFSANSEQELALLRDCRVAQEGRPARELLREAGANELARVAFSGTLAPQSPDEIVARDGQRCIAFMERHAQVNRDGSVRRELFTETRVPHLVAVRKLTGSSWTLGVTGQSEERINLKNPQSAHGFTKLFRVRRDHRVPLAESTDYFHITESVIPAGLVLNYMGSLSYDPLSQQLHMRLLEVGFADMNELVEAAGFGAGVYKFFSRFCLFTTVVLLGFAARRAYKLYRLRSGSGKPSNPRHPPPQSAGASASGGDSMGQPAPPAPLASSNPCGVCFDRAPNTVLVDCGHTLCQVCAAAVAKCPFCSALKNSPPVRLFVP